MGARLGFPVPLQHAKGTAETAIRRTLEAAKNMRGSMVDSLPRVRRFLDALSQGAPVLTPVKEPSRTIPKPRAKKAGVATRDSDPAP